MQNIQVNMQFNADTSNAQSQIQQLQSTLKSIATTHVNVQGGSIDQAVQSAQMLNQHLTAATNVNTGKINFTKLQGSLKAANTDLNTLANNLLAMGPKGQQAFSQVANAVAHAELSVKKTNTALAAFGTTLMNTIKWQAASTMIHGVMSAFSNAVNHIEKLDTALNRIQIVTNKTSAEMASFAKRAQDLSKALSSTTEEYAKASLIFFQQGLGEDEVLKRTEATIKMAKVTGDAVQTVSDQLTAIWNNFDNGTKSLEYYVDVITALGAATASSTSEISDGLQKFAAIAETVGLSYEYAATALATVTAETRQSADVVGTAFKTLFARMEGLKLGETLDDGTTLNQYSQAMAKAGINIKDANGNLKDMDIILDEMGKKWQTLNKDQQVALAQQVGGIRQYNQLIALMDNWDTFKINLEIAEDSKGTLEEQMNIYQTSIEASEKALQNAKESLYETLFNSDMLKSFNNGLADILEMFTRLIEKAGGLKGLLEFGGLLILKTLLPNLMGFITKITGSISNVIGLTQRKKIDTVDKMAKTERRIAGQEETRFWGGKSDRAGRAFTKAGIANDQGKTDQRNKYVNKGKGIAQQINKREQSITDHKIAADNARAAREAENAERIKEGKRAKGEGFKEHWHNTRAMQLEQRAVTGKAASIATLGVKTDNLPSANTVDNQASSGEMSAQISQEQAGYTAAILDSKKEYLALENQLTDAQKAQYKNYEDQLNAENDLLKIARERQLVSKDQANEATKVAENAIEMSEDGGEKIEAAARVRAKEEIDQSDIGKQKKIADDAYNKEIQKIDKDTALTKEQKESAKKIAKDKHDNNDAVKNYDKEISDRATSLISSDNFTRTVDFGGAKTKGASEGLSRKMAGADAATQASLGSVAEAAGMGADGSGTAVASVENLEKLGALQGQYNTDAQIAVDLQGELSTAIGTSAASTKKGTKEYENGNKALKQSGTFAQKYGNEMKAAAKQMEKTGELTQDQVKAVEKLVDAGADVELEGMNSKDLEGIQKTLGKVEGGLTKAGAAAGQMANTMATDMAGATGVTKDTFLAVSDGTKKLATDTAAAEQQVNKLHNITSKPIPVQPDPYGGLRMGAQGAMQAITGLTMGSRMLATGLQTAFDPEASGIEKLTGLMMVMQGVQSLLTLTQAANNIVVGIGNVLGAAAITIKEKGFGGWLKEIALKGLDTAATVVNAVAKVFNAEASKGLAGVIAGALAAALIVGTVLMVANTVKTEQSTKEAQKNAEAKKEQANSSREAAEAAREELDTVIELTKAYTDALKIYEETGNGKEELRQAAFDAVDAMGLEGQELNILAGNYANLTEKIREYNAAKAGETVKKSHQSLAAVGAEFLAAEDVPGSGGMNSNSAGNGKYFLSLATGPNVDVINKWLAANDSPWMMESGELRAYYTSSADIPYLLKSFQALYNGVSAMASADDQKNMQFFDSVQQMRDSGTWDLMSDASSAYDTHIDNSIVASQAQHLIGVDTQEAYNEAYEKMKHDALAERGLLDASGKIIESRRAEAEEIIKQLDSSLKASEEWSNFELKRRGLNSIQEQFGSSAAAQFITKDETTGESGLTEWAKKNNISEDEAIDLFLKINPQYFGDVNDITAVLDEMQDYLNANQIIVKYDLISGAKAALKEDMSSQDWSQFYSQYKDLFDPNSSSYIGMSFKDFTQKSHSERSALLSSQQGSKAEALGVQKETEEQILQQMQGQEWKDNYINTTASEIVETEKKKVEDARDETYDKYSDEQVEYFTDEEYLGEATRWKKGVGVEGGMSQEEYDELDKWAKEHSWSGAEQYLSEKWNYLNLMNGVGDNEFGDEFNLGNLNMEPITLDNAKKKAESQYDNELKGQEGKITALDNEAYLSSLEEADAKITEVDLDLEEVYNQAETIQEMAVASEEFANSLEHDADAAKEVAKEISRYNRSVESLESGYEDWSKALKSGNISEQAAAAKELDAVYSDMLDLDFGSLSNEFLRNADNLELAQKAAEGSQEAYNQLQIAAATDIYTKKVGKLSEETLAAIERVANTEEVDVGEKITVGKSSVADDLWSIYNDAYMTAIEGGKTVAEAKAIANEIMQSEGFDVGEIEMEEKTVTVTGQLPTGYKPEKGVIYTDSNGETHTGTDWEPVPGETYTYTTTMLVPKSGGKGSFTKSAESIGGKKKASSGGGGGGEKKKADVAKRSDVVDRYKEIDDALDNNSRAMDAASKAADRLYGKDRLNKMHEVNNLLQEEIELTQQKRQEAEAYLQEDKTALEKAMAEAGINFTFDAETGDITNYTSEMDKLFNELNAATEAANADGNADEKEQEKITAIQEKIDKVKNALADYEETKETMQDLAQEEIDKFNEWQDNNYELLNIELELKIKVNDRDLERLEYYMKKLEGDFYQRAEAGALLGEKAGTYQKQLGDRGDQYEKIMAQWMNKKISDADAMAALEEQLSGIYSDLSSLQETDTEMMNFYGESIALAQEEMSKFTDQMDHQASVLDHYQNILALTGQEFDYESMGVVLEGQAKMAENGMKAAKAEFDFYKKQAEDKKDLYEQALAEGNTAAAELYKKEYEDALAAANDAEEKFLSAAENTAEKLKAVLENSMKGFAKDLETALTGGTTFEDLNTQMERAASLQEEYLTTTNKIYETNKVMRKAQQEIDKTTNATAKRKLKSFIQETQQLQDQSKLSKFELEIQQAKYDLLLAEIALEEAQNAKSTVRLQRDSEGNFGYVYTADLSATEDAAQNFADKQNELYNIGLEGANNYKEKYIQTLGEMNDALVELAEKRNNGEFASDQEYQEQVLATKEFYYQKLKDYSNLYTTAVGVDAQIVTDSWATQFDTIKLSAEDLEAQVNTYLGNVNTAFNDYNTGLQQITNLTIGPNNLEDLKTKTEALVDENGKLLLAIAGEDGKGGLIGAMGEEFKAISGVTGAWAAQRKEVVGLIGEYEKLALNIKKVLDKKSPGGSDDEDTDESKTTTNSSEKKEEEKQESTGSEKSEEKQNTPPPQPSESEIQYGTWERVLEVFNKIDTGKWPGSFKDRIKIGTAEGYTREEIGYGQKLIDLTYPPSLGGEGYSPEEAKKIMGFDTGGYTGTWGSYGKMAMLHEKELVLNKEDTENLLTSMNILDKIVSTIDLYTMNAQMTSSLSSPMFGEMQKADTLEQQVHIEAHFPNVSQHSEIEEAFSNLINTASQYANRR